jgi:hypothetical protein
MPMEFKIKDYHSSWKQHQEEQCEESCWYCLAALKSEESSKKAKEINDAKDNQGTSTGSIE